MCFPSIEDLAKRSDWPEIRADLRAGLRQWAMDKGLMMDLDRRCNKSLYDELISAAECCQCNDYRGVEEAVERIKEMMHKAKALGV